MPDVTAQPKRRIPAHLLPAAGALLFAAFGSAGQAGFLLLPALLVFAIWALVNVVAMTRRPAQRILRSTNVAIWTVALALVAGVHMHRAEAARYDAEAVVARIEDWRAEHGRWPTTLADMGEAAAQGARRQISYGVANGEPFLAYRSTFAPFDAHIYDFLTAQWHYRGD